MDTSALETPVAIVTGAGSGVGRATCRQLAEAGWRLGLVGRTERTLRDTARELGGEQHENFKVLVTDMADRQAVRLLAPRMVERFGRLDGIVNNAAVLIPMPAGEADAAALDAMFSANVIGPALLVSAAWPTFVRQNSGCIVNVSSMSSVDPFPGLGIYGASKAGLEGLTRAYAIEGRAHGIRAFSIVPGAIETAMLRRQFSENEVPRSRALSADAVASVVVSCLTGERDAQQGGAIVLPSPR